MIAIRKASERGHANHGWLDTYHTFSFGNYYEPNHMGFQSLRVMNEDWIQAGAGFPTHPHRDMEIVTWVLEGALEHKDNTGGGGVIRPGTLQHMSAGTGITHSEFNHSPDHPVHLYQIWIVPEQKGLEPGYKDQSFDPASWQGRFRALASRDGREDSLKLRQDAILSVAELAPNATLAQQADPQRHHWFQVTQGRITLNGTELGEGDGAAVTAESDLNIEAVDPSQILWFDLK